MPRPAAEIEGGADGAAVLTGAARVLTADGGDVTRPFLAGAQAALAVARSSDVKIAILKEGSPSCGSLTIYDGAFRGRRLPGRGVTAALLESYGIAVFNEDQITEAGTRLRELTEPAEPAEPA
nr:hypothetical protein GCM10020093_047020 [Planobispora longispora]